jgi:hypothetical protein
VGRVGLVDIAKSEALIRRRHDHRVVEEGHRPSEEMYEESCRVFAEQRQEALAWQSLDYHRRRRAAHRQTFALLDAMHEQEIQRYSEMLGLDDEPKEAV